MRFMKLEFAAILMLIVGLASTSCTKDINDEIGLEGRWMEKAPVEDRTELYFYDENKLFTADADGTVEDYFYSIQDTTIYIQAQTGNEAATELFFRRVDDMTLQIENLYPSAPEAGTSFMIFERK